MKLASLFKTMNLSLKTFLCLAVVLCLQKFADGQKTGCPGVTPMAGFDAEKFQGRWFEILRYKSPLDKLVGTCGSWNFTMTSSKELTISLTLNLRKKEINTKGQAKMNQDGSFKWKASFSSGEKFLYSFQIQKFQFENLFQFNSNLTTTFWTLTTPTTLLPLLVPASQSLVKLKLLGSTDARKRCHKSTSTKPWRTNMSTQTNLATSNRHANNF